MVRSAVPLGQEGWALSGRGSRRWIECCRICLDSSLPIALDEPVGFKTPANNVYCLLEEDWLRCDAKQIIDPVSPKPPDCYLDWGNAFVIAPTVKKGITGQWPRPEPRPSHGHSRPGRMRRIRMLMFVS